MRSAKVVAVLAFASIAALTVAVPVQAVTVRVSCPDCEDIPGWALVILVVVGLLIAMGILWLPRRLARNVASPQTRARIVVGGWLVFTVLFVLGVRALVVLLGGT
jgi:hypothetical protein